jgi:plasmid stabilization system protein ParE
MKGYELRLSSEAESCIEEQLLWYEAEEANGGAELADRWMRLLEAAIDVLSHHPERHSLAPENGRWLPAITIRQLRFKPWKTQSAWRILYVIDTNAKQVVVLQIRHERRPLLGDDKLG